MALARSSRRQLSFPDESHSMTCELCKQSHDKNNTALVHTWKSVEALDFVMKKGLKKDSVVCLPCRADIRRVLRDPSHKPRWDKKISVEGCCIKICSEEVFANSHMADVEVIQSILSECGLDCQNVPIPTPLCKHHYYEVYKVLQPPKKNCSTCETSLRHVNCRPCPNPEITLQQHIQFSCKVKKYGTLLYRPNSDFKALLQQALWKLKSKQVQSTDIPVAKQNDDMKKQMC